MGRDLTVELYPIRATKLPWTASVKTAVGTFQDINRPIHAIAKASFQPVDIEIVGIEAHEMMMFHNEPPRELLPFLIPWAPSKYGRIIYLRSSRIWSNRRISMPQPRSIL